jgi:hypothetical protein
MASGNGMTPLDPFKIPSPLSERSVSQGRSMVGVAITLNIVGLFVLVARIWTRTVPRRGWNWDDYLILVAWVRPPLLMPSPVIYSQ